MEQILDKISINGKTYVLEESIDQNKNLSNSNYVIVRTYSAGVFAGYLKSKLDKEVILNQARRIWRWDGANSLSQLAIDGTAKPKDCKFPEALEEITLTEAIEIIPCTEKAKKSIESIPIWKF